jgi:very-short-patch-repair endonuclease
MRLLFPQQLVYALNHESGPVELGTVHLSQLLQAHLASQFLGLGLITLPASMLQVAARAYREQARKVTVSNGQREVGESLRRLGISHELEYITADGLFSIDLAILDRRIALEFDGPSHFTTNTLEPLGHTRLRDRLLSAMGWCVVSIPFFEWDRLHQTEQRDAYVKRRVHRSL